MVPREEVPVRERPAPKTLNLDALMVDTQSKRAHVALQYVMAVYIELKFIENEMPSEAIPYCE